MQTGDVTTPFGRRSMSLALVKRQMAIKDTDHNTRIEKWKVFRDVCEARERLGLQDRALAVLDALLTFYPHGELDSSRGLVVFPSNAHELVRRRKIISCCVWLCADLRSVILPNRRHKVQKPVGNQVQDVDKRCRSAFRCQCCWREKPV